MIMLLSVILLCGLASARLSDDKCTEYFKESALDTPFEIKEAAFMGLLGYSEDDTIRYHCPATLISESFAITPAYCITTLAGKPGHIISGVTNPEKKGDNYKILDVLEAIIHPNYRRNDSSNSIALVKFSPPLVPNEYVKPGCLYTKDVKDSQKLADFLWESKSSGQNLFKAESSIVPILACKQNYDKQKRAIDEKSHLCLVRKYDENHFKANTGGISIIYEDGIPKIAAIDNFGPTIPTSTYPDVSTKLYNFINWIEKNVWSS